MAVETKARAHPAQTSDTLRIDAAGKTTTAAQNRSQVSMKWIGGKWLMDDLQSVSVS